MTFTHALSTNNYGPAKFIVSANAYEGTHTTIASALTAASSGDTIFIRTGTYTENPTLKAGVNLTAYDCDQFANVTIVGKCTFTAVGSVTLSGIKFQTNSDFCIAVTGSSASNLGLVNCFILSQNNTAVSFTSSSGSSAITFNYCTFDTGTTGVAFYSHSASGGLSFRNCIMSNSGSSTTANTCSAGTLNYINTFTQLPLNYSSSGAAGITNSDFDFISAGINVTCLTTSGTGNVTIVESALGSGSASAISVGAGTAVNIASSSVFSSNTNAITGAGTLTYGGVTFNGTSSTINTTTLVRKITRPSFSTVSQVFTGSGTYTPTAGMAYCVIECVGGGGGGGGSASSSATFYSGAGGGGGGGYAKLTATATTIGASQTVTIGTAGTAGTAGNNAGGNGGDTSVGALCIGKGGTGGTGSSGSSASNGGAGGVAGTGDFTVPGQTGGAGLFSSITAATGLSGPGGNSHYGTGAAIRVANSASLTGGAASNYGGGGGGGVSYNNTGTVAGGAGTAGVVYIQEYILA